MSLITPFYNFIQHWTPGWARLRAAEPPQGLLSLPVELLTEILKALPWTDVLHMRETCKLLSEATKTRAVWAHLVQEHISSKEVPPRLERPIELYTSQELERLLLRWKSAEIGWGKDDGRAASERSFHCEPPGLTHLIQGGRWFLVTSPIGAVTYYDLEAETISGVELIPAHFPPSQWGTTDIHVALEVDTSSPLLKFNMAISSKHRMPKHPQAHALHIWSVTAILDDSGHVVGLSASRLALLRHLDKLWSIIDFSLRGPYLALSCYIYDQSLDYIVVVRWDQGDNCPYCFRVIQIDHNYNDAKLILLPNTRLILIANSYFQMWDYSAIEETTDFIPDSDDTRDHALLWEKNFAFKGYLGPKKSLVSVFYVGNTARILVSGFNLYTFSVNALSYEPPPIHELFKYPDGYMEHVQALGASHGVVYDDDERIFTLMAYNLPEGLHSSSSFLYKNNFPTTSENFGLLAFDEGTGRVVLSFPGAPGAYVFDYALPLV